MSLEFTLVRRAISLAVIDGPDAGDNPDILQAQGSVLFEPVIKKGDSIQVQTRGGSETYALAPIECPINDGIISHRGQDGVKLPAGGEAANPSLIRWKATFSRMQAGGKSFTLAPVVFDAVPGGEIDLTMVAPVAGAPEGVVRGPRGTSLESIIVDGSELVFTAVDDAGSFEIARIPLDEMVRAEAEAAADGVRDALAVDVAASQSARDAAEGHADRAATSESNAAASETNAKQSETNAGDFAAVATTAATEAVDAMERATDLAGGDFATQEYVDNGLAPKADKSYVDAEKWKRGTIPASTSSLSQLADGVWSIESYALRTALGIPGARYGDVQLMTTSGGYRTAIFVNTDGEVWTAGISAGAQPTWRATATLGAGSSKMLDGTVPVDSLESGYYHVISGSVSATLGLPTSTSGSLWVQNFSGSTGVREWRPTSLPEVWGSRKHGSAWGAWNRDSYVQSSSLTSNTPVEDLPTGLYRVGNGTVATTLGLPAPSSGSLWVHRMGGDIGRMEWRPTASIAVHHRRLHGASWTAWEPVASGGGSGVTWGTLSGKPSSYPPESHDHNDAYYTKAEIDKRLDPTLDAEISGVSVALEDVGVGHVPNSIGVDGVLYGHNSGMLYPVRFPNGSDAAPEVGPRFSDYATSGGSGIVWVERTSAGYVVIWAIDARNSEYYFSENWMGPYEKVLDAGPWNLTGRAKSRLINGVTWLLWGEYHNHLKPTWPLKRWLSTDGGRSWRSVRETVVNNDTVNSHHHAGLIRADGRLYSSEGDGLENAITVYSDDLGKSWIPIPEPDKLRFNDTLRMYHQPTMMIDFGDYIATSPDSGPWKPGMWLMDPNTHDRKIIWELTQGGPYSAAHLQYGRSLYAQEGPTGREVYALFPDAASGNRTSYVAATPNGGRRWGVVAAISTEGGQLNTGVIGPDKDGYCYMRGTNIPTYGSNLVRFKKLDWSQIDY